MRPDKPMAHGAPVGYQGPDYYGLSPLKASSYHGLVWGYTWVAGLAGSSQVLATLADWSGRPALRGVVRRGRALAAVLPMVGAGQLIADLHTPERFYMMLRIFRPTSPMSIGSWLLTSFSLSSLLAGMGQSLGSPALARAAQVPAALTGAGMSIYTASLLSATSTPLWSTSPRLLAGRFGASALASAAAALSLLETLSGRHAAAARLDAVLGLAALVEFGCGKGSEAVWRAKGIGDVLHEPPMSTGFRANEVLGVALPLACLAVNMLAPRRSATLSVLGALGTLAGSLAMRAAVFRAGNESAKRPRDAFAIAQEVVS